MNKKKWYVGKVSAEGDCAFYFSGNRRGSKKIYHDD